MYEACLSLPQNRREAALIAEQLEALARALREWPAEAWRSVSGRATSPDASLFERLVARTAPAALDARSRERALISADTVAAVLGVLWAAPPEQAASTQALTTPQPELAPA